MSKYIKQLNTQEEILYNNILLLSRNKLFYTKFDLIDTFQNRILLIFIHISFIFIKIKQDNKDQMYKIFYQKMFDLIFNNIESNMREIGYGDSVINKNMRFLTKIFYNILVYMDVEYNERLDEYFKLKKDYEITYKQRVRSITKTDDLTNKQKRAKVRKIKMKCIGCKRNVGTIFSNKNNIIRKDKVTSDFDLYNTMLRKMNINNKPIDFNFINYSSLSNTILSDKLRKEFKKYTLLHLDEKWFSSLYINKFSDISPQKEEFLIFIEKFFAKAKQNIIITTGIKYTPLIYELIDKFFTKINTNFYEYSFDNFKAIICLNSSIKELEIISMNSNNIITCHGPLSLFSGFFNINLIDIIEKTQEKWYYRHTSHIKKYNKLYRKNFKELSKEIILTIK